MVGTFQRESPSPGMTVMFSYEFFISMINFKLLKFDLDDLYK